MCKHAKEEIWANTKLKAELTKTLGKPPWVLPPRCDCTWEEQTKPERRGGSWRTALERMPGTGWQHSPPCEGYTVKWELSCPTCLSCKTTEQLWKTATSSLAPALVFFASPLPSGFLWIVHSQEQCFPSPGLTEGQRSSAGRALSDNSLRNQGRIFQGCLSSPDFRPRLQHRAGQGRRAWGAVICHWPHRPCKTLPSLDHYLMPS